MNLRSKIAVLPWISAAVGLVATVCPYFLPVPPSWKVEDAWLTYLLVSSIAILLLALAYLDWRQKRDSQLPPPQICALILHLSQHGFSGTPSSFNTNAETIHFGEKLSALLPSTTDYCSEMMASGLLTVTSITDYGTKLDGTPATFVKVCLSKKGESILRVLSEV